MVILLITRVTPLMSVTSFVTVALFVALFRNEGCVAAKNAASGACSPIFLNYRPLDQLEKVEPS
jgi:hypothetical protein